ncbi:CMGC protein kinase [Trichophyton rubrum D6]|uniref:CMGC protein kinase n=3 Tax=Trichophyton TaxID=5550 RepID=F2SZZ7_TRIRC|nr:CMGC protein kinase [Trichophyton rubrum CBS 118892]EZF27422.1 CMGC protein kinase [Trichophyton rubrum MR850]EZF46548.1 CMGC protein kinase [Trichophyton rubrum CBS 100081]EZF57110.1 CMGC protein kinase [Trichophyton rubrum CBS 288.86]EZF67806.1 CMGC protein kinase [Trichophyton rubrum CBS 289.86]EZF78481.1 CMGC protein kinase [Trichophyton soudanense CBS 452.61]EZF89049.1 CMGC protein kinase [Trichophyton rubrum MR1448]EZF99932.1 CMGC protein kinase [Trichophyton rubrum MR1459]EZG10831
MSRSIYDLLAKGQKVLINGRQGQYQVIKALKRNVFQASTVESKTPVIIKTEGSDPVIYQTEANCYGYRCVAESPYIRALHEVVDNDTDRCMVFEYLDTDLWSLRARAQELGQPFLKAAARSILEAVKAFSDMDGHFTALHTDINPNNVLVSKADSPKPIVKLADLGAIIPSEGFDDFRLQGVEIRAPEIWKGMLPRPPCQVWSVGVTLTHFFANRVIFGNWDQDCRVQEFPLEVNKSAWAIGKIIKLTGSVKRDEDPKYQLEFDLAELFVNQGLIKVGTLEEELAKVNAPKGCVDFIHHLLTIDDKARPTAEQALQHPWFQSPE